MHSGQVRRNNFMQDGFAPWTGRASVKLTGVPAHLPRQTDIIDQVFWMMRRSTQPHGIPDEELVRDAFIDTSQSVLRSRPSQPCTPTFTSSSIVYSYQHDVLLTGGSVLQIMGWPQRAFPPSVLTDAECRSLGGDSFSVQFATLIQQCCICNPWGPWWHRQRA